MVRKQTTSIVLRMSIIAGLAYGWCKGLVQPHLQVEDTMPVNWKFITATVLFLVAMRKL